MTDLTKDQILAADDLRTEKVAVPEWGGDVYIRQMSGREQDKFEAECRGKNGGPNLINMRARMVAACLVDSEGKKLFTDEDVIKLSNKSGSVLNRLIDKIGELNRITGEDLEKIAKN